MTKGKFIWLLLLFPFFSQPCVDIAEGCPLCRLGSMASHKRQTINVIGKKAGNVLIRIKDDKLHAFFLGGGHDINRLVRIEVEEIPLTVTVPGKGEMTLILKASPIKLADEKIGYCSHFIAKADWLKDVKEFDARGEVVFKGVRQDLVIKYPKGHDIL